MNKEVLPREFGQVTQRLRRMVVTAPLVGAVVLLMITPISCTTVTDYEVAVLENPITGRVGDSPFSQGLYFQAPLVFWRHYSTYETREIQFPGAGRSEQAQALTSDQLTITVDAAYRYQIVPSQAVDLFLTVGDMDDVRNYVYTSYRTALRDAIAELTGAEILSTDRLRIATRVEELMDAELNPKGIEVVRFFVREIQPPPAVRQAIELKLQREQEVQSQRYQTEIVKEQAQQKREEALGIRDAQDIIGQSLTPQYLSYYYMQTLAQVGEKQGNVIVAPTEGGNLMFQVPSR